MPGQRLPMRKIRDVLRLTAAGMSSRKIAASLVVGATTVVDCLQRARAAGVSWPLLDDLSDEALEARLFPASTALAEIRARRPQPHWPTIHRELRRPGVTLQLVWEMLPAVRIRAYSAEKLRLLCGGPSPSVVECSRVASPINAGLRPPPTAADGIDRGCHTAAICLQEVDGKVRSAYPPNFMPENFAAPSLRGS